LVVAGAAMNSATHVGVNGRRKQLAPAHCGRNTISSGMIMRRRMRITTMKKMLTMDEALSMTWFTFLFPGLFVRSLGHSPTSSRAFFWVQYKVPRCPRRTQRRRKARIARE